MSFLKNLLGKLFGGEVKSGTSTAPGTQAKSGHEKSGTGCCGGCGGGSKGGHGQGTKPV